MTEEQKKPEKHKNRINFILLIIFIAYAIPCIILSVENILDLPIHLRIPSMISGITAGISYVIIFYCYDLRKRKKERKENTRNLTILLSIFSVGITITLTIVFIIIILS